MNPLKEPTCSASHGFLALSSGQLGAAVLGRHEWEEANPDAAHGSGRMRTDNG